MRIEALRLTWFRGAGAAAALEPKGKSLACFGPNGSGKSTFVDALEYLASDGKVDHLSHEYAGKGQINGVRNTHAPASTNARIEVAFGRREDGIIASITAKGKVEIEPRSEASHLALESWRSAQLILRQDEVARFINATKGDKYSALLPLLGLAELETVADNVHKLEREVEKQGRISELEARVGGAVEPDAFDRARATVLKLSEKYGGDGAAGHDLAAHSDSVAVAIQRRFDSLDNSGRTRQVLDEVRRLDLQAKACEARDAATSVCKSWSSIVLGNARGQSLEGAETVLSSAAPGDSIECPSCGRPILRTELDGHVRTELEKLARVRADGRRWDTAVAALNVALASFRDLADRLPAPNAVGSASGAAEIRAFATEAPLSVGAARVEAGWPAAAAGESVGADSISTGTGSSARSAGGRKKAASSRSTPPPRPSVPPPDLNALTRLAERAQRLDAAVAAELSSPAPTASDLLADRDALQNATAVLDRRAAARRLRDVQAIAGALGALEDSIRHSMRLEAERTLEEISTEVQRLWSRLHPGEPIEDVKLYAGDTDKALDVSLKYYGRDQPSPRLTLSEGHRNSLGLCIFLALVRLRAPVERPIVLDDIISSLDREHRGRVIDLLAAEFADRQVLLFTHDHEWFAELRAMLPQKSWAFAKLLPWDGPGVGLRWSGVAGRLEEARKLLSDGHIEAAANRARADMDEQTAIAAEKLELHMPYRRGERNDHRTWNDFLPRLVSVGRKNLSAEPIEGAEASVNPVDSWERASGLLNTIGNRASHGGSIAKGDAEALIQACENALDALRCPACRNPLWTAKTPKQYQCGCGRLGWKLT